jgi:pimeloyl-ACP methyl ester carboxylesterase
MSVEVDLAETVDTFYDGAGARQRSGPRTIHSITELPRVLVEMSRLALSWPALLAAAPRGDGHPVMVLPGFTAGDDSMLMLRRLLTQLDYKALPWLQGTNVGHPRLLEGAMRRFYRLHHAFDTKISLVGQSLGGVFAREIAREFPDAVRCVITLGSPFAGGDDSPTNPMMEKLFERMSGLTIDELRAQRPMVMNTDPLPMPTTALYSKEDGVVAWSACVEEEDDHSENIRVIGSHSGMAMNPDVVRVVADRLAQDPNNWQKFDYSRGCNRWIYPRS